MTDTPTSAQEDEVVSDQPEVLRKVLLGRRRAHVAALETIDAEIADIQRELNRQIDDARMRRRPIEEALSHVDGLLRFEGWMEPEDDVPHVPQVFSSNGKAPADAAHDFLSSVGKPVHYRELALKLAEKGIYLSGKDPAATLLSKMSRDQRFKRAPERGVYGLASWRMRSRSSKKRRTKRSKNRRS